MINKKFRKALIPMLVILLFTGCPGAEKDASDSHEFIDQVLQGTHTNQSWTFSSGVAEEKFDDEWWIDLYNISPEAGADPWDFGAYPFDGYLKINFSIPKDGGTGLHELNFNLTTFDGFTATFYDPSDSMNTIAADGAIEITEIDTAAGTISGKMEIWYETKDSGYYVNGNFEVPIDPADLI